MSRHVSPFRLSSSHSMRQRLSMSLLGLSLLVLVSADDPQPESSVDSLTEQKAALATFNDLIGEWRGVGQVKRGSRRGAWTETAKWVWTFDKESVGVTYQILKGQNLFTQGTVTYSPQEKKYTLVGTFKDGRKTTFVGNWNDEKKKLAMESAADSDGQVYRITLTRLNEKRTIVLFQKRSENSTYYARMAEVGYTRAGMSLAVRGADGPECIVTGGKGTTPVTFQGKTYYVCCTGCKQAFDDDPAGVIAEYKAKVAKRKAKQNKE